MAKEKLVKNITSRDEDFAQWYTDVVREANLCDYSSVKGCMNYLPNGYAIWELIQADLDRRFKETGVENVYLPVLIPESLLEKEADHVEGFAPEVAWVTHGGMERLQERLCVRPTSETLFCDLWAKDCKIIQRSSKGMEPVELRSPLGEDNKTIPSFKRILMAGRSHTSCNI